MMLLAGEGTSLPLNADGLHVVIGACDVFDSIFIYFNIDGYIFLKSSS